MVSSLWYSFQATNGGFEAFVTTEGKLHVALHVSGDHFHVFAVDSPLLADGLWVGMTDRLWLGISDGLWIRILYASNES